MSTLKYRLGHLAAALTTTALLLNFPVAHAALISPIVISGSTSFNDGTLFGFSFGGSGDFSVIEGGATTTSTFNDFTVTGMNPLTGTLTETGDGFDMSGTASVTDAGFAIGMDTSQSILNGSASDIFEVVYELTYSNRVNATGADAFADSELRLELNTSEIFSSDLASDTLFGNEVDGVATGGFGGELIDTGTESFSVVLIPAEVASLDLIWTLEGGDFASGLAEADLTTTLRVVSVTQVPLPGTLLLMLSGLVALGRLLQRSGHG